MAKTISRSNNNNYQLKGFHFLGLFGLVLLLQKGNAIQFNVGGANGWTVYDNGSSYDYNQWAERTRFQIGDSLLFVYKPDEDSVLQVKKQDYDNCTTTAALATFNNGHTVFTFNHSGPFYFISGNKNNCLKNQRLVVTVLADRINKNNTNHFSNTNETTTLSPPPSNDTGIVPSPAPAGQESPPSGTVEINPTPSPIGQPPSAASSIVMSFTYSVIGAFFASSFILVS